VRATLPLIEPVTEGEKVTDIVHFALVASLPPQGLVPLPVAVKSADPVNETIFTLATLLLVTVTVRADAEVPTC
jgi:hypothetical protein